MVDRIRRLSLFASVGVDELFRIARTGHQTRHEPATTVLREGTAPEEYLLLLDGEVLATRRGAEARRIAAPAALGFREALVGRRVAETIRTAGPVVLIEFSRLTLRTLLSDNIDLVRGLFRVVVDAVGIPRDVIRGAPPAELESFGASLTAGQKGLALRRIPLFARVTGAEMLHLAAIAKRVALEPGMLLTDQTAPAGVGIVLSGELGLRDAGDDARRMVLQARQGDVFGLYGMLVGSDAQTRAWRYVTTSACAILWIERGEFFDLLSQRSDLLQQVFAARDEPPSWAPSAPPAADPRTPQ